MFDIIPSKRENIEKQFVKIAEQLIRSTQLATKKNHYQIAEIEFYFFNINWHPDKSTHCNKRQERTGFWYFHRYNNSEKTKKGNRKGLDITIGNKENLTFGGILIRAIQNSADDTDYIYGPSLVVDRLLSETQIQIEHAEIIENKSVFENDYIKIIEKENDNNIVLNCPRYGLGKNTPQDFISAPYRFFTFPYKQHKEKEKVILPYLKKYYSYEELNSIFRFKTIS